MAGKCDSERRNSRRRALAISGLAWLLACAPCRSAVPRVTGEVAMGGGAVRASAGRYAVRHTAVTEAVVPAGNSSGRFASAFQASAQLARMNAPPRTAVSQAEVGGDELSELTLTQAALVSLFGVTDADGDPRYFRLVASAGSLAMDGSIRTGEVLLGPGQSVGWRLPAHADAPLAELTATAHDGIADAPAAARLRFVYTPKLAAPVGARAVRAGEAADFVVSAYGSPPLNYQWRLNGQPVPGGTNATLRLTPAARSEGGLLEITVANRVGQIVGQGRLRVLVPTRMNSLTWTSREGVRVAFVDADGGAIPSHHPLDDFVLEYSDDLKNWIPLPNGAGPQRQTDGQLLMNDPASTNRLHRFYRLKERGEN